MIKQHSSARLFIQKKWFILLLGFSFSLILSIFIRGSNVLKGVDTLNYIQLFNSADGRSFSQYFTMSSWTGSPGFVSLNYFIHHYVTSNDYLYLFLITLLMTSLITFVYGLFFTNRSLSLYALALVMCFSTSSLFLLSSNVIRQGFSIPFFLLFIYFYSQRQLIKSACFLFVASLFHFSAALFSPIFLLYPFFEYINKPLLCIYGSIIISLIMKPIVYTFLKVFGLDLLLHKLLVSEYTVPIYQDISTLIKVVLLLFFATFFCGIYRNKGDEFYDRLIRLFLCLMSYVFLFLSFSGIVNRFLLFTSLLLPILFALMIMRVKHKQLIYFLSFLGSLFYLGIVLNHPSVQNNIF